jgi:5-methylcytosine-specific restriction endonuclease McrA
MAKALNRWKKELHIRDNFTCFYCGDKREIENLHLDHILPKSLGGKDRKDNLITACCSCNLIKGNLTQEDFLKKAEGRFIMHYEEMAYYQKIIKNLRKNNVKKIS